MSLKKKSFTSWKSQLNIKQIEQYVVANPSQ